MHKITLIPGDGIGPEVTASTVKIIEATGFPVEWEVVNAGAQVYEETGSLIPDSVFESIEKNKVALKGPIATPIGKGFRSINVYLRKKYDLYSNIREVKNIPGLKSKFDDVDLVIFRENTEGLYIGIEEMEDENTAVAKKVITRKGSTRIAKSAFEYALENKKDKVTVAHKANILKIADGLFLDCVREVAKDYPSIKLEEVIIDNMCMQMVMNPAQFGVIVTTNLYGDILSDLASGLVGGLGMVPGANIGEDIAIFEAVHGSAPDIAGKNLANPIAVLLSGVHMLKYLGDFNRAELITKAIEQVVKDGKFLTKDLGGNASNTEITDAIIEKINLMK
jgi:isocitrate dehydrogenase (NAD+)